MAHLPKAQFAKIQSLVCSTCIAAMLSIAAQPTIAQDRGITYNLYGTPGLIDMPAALSAGDATIAATIGYFSGQQRNTLTFQISPRLSGSFRYGSVDDFRGEGTGSYFDRSFDLRYQLTDEGDIMPAIAIGLRDFLGTGLYSSEYVAATKTLSDSVRVTAGLGWGRLGSYNGFTNPLGVIDASLETRPELDYGDGGEISAGQFFRGDAALFGGVEWSFSDRLTFKAEYSSDAYVGDVGAGLMERDSPFNFGLVYQPRDDIHLGLAFIHGNELAFTGTLMVNPQHRPVVSGFEAPPVPVAIRQQDARAAQSWDRAARPEADLRTELQIALAREGIDLNGIEITDRTVRVRYSNNRYRAEAQGMGRTARVLTQVLPASIETFILEPQRNGVPISSVTMQRRDIETYENQAGGTTAMMERSQLAAAGPSAGFVAMPPRENRFQYGISPYVSFLLFGGDNPVNVEAGLEFSASYEIRPNLVLSGAVRKRLTAGSEAELEVDPPVEPVRTNGNVYAAEGDPGLEYLTLAHYGRVAPDIYSRVSVGYLEPMFGGVSGELLWAPVAQRYALGVEVNYVRQRAFDQLFGFQEYDVVTGHVSGYYDFQNGFHAQVDIGRYLAGDWGATFALDREFSNGWRLGAFATLTDVPFEDFGEGSFDKGIRITIPSDFLLGQPTRRTFTNTLTSLTRDGGARLAVDGRLYETVRSGHENDLNGSWGRFWR
ncbi:MAG: YjbH domain-containing protein [Rhodobacteraceae bacterium]|nr:YjbH domain-containing protein [Paracoccaceae bacterium]